MLYRVKKLETLEKVKLCSLPGNDNEQVQSVPRITEIRAFTEQTHRDDFDTHLGGKEDEDGVVEAFEDATAQRRTDDVLARLKHAERHAVEQDDSHADSLEPRAGKLQSRISYTFS